MQWIWSLKRQVVTYLCNAIQTKVVNASSDDLEMLGQQWIIALEIHQLALADSLEYAE